MESSFANSVIYEALAYATRKALHVYVYNSYTINPYDHYSDYRTHSIAQKLINTIRNN